MNAISPVSLIVPIPMTIPTTPRRVPTVSPTKAFLSSLKTAMRVVNHRDTVPILQCVRVTVVDNVMTITGTDMERIIVETLTFISPDCDLVVSAKRLYDTLRTVKPGVDIALETDGSFLSLAGVSLPTLPLSDFPGGTPGHLPVVFTIDAATLLGIVLPASSCMSIDPTRYYLNGVFLRYVMGKLVAVATDGRRLAYAECDAPDGSLALSGISSNPTGIIIPMLTIQDMIAILDKQTGPVTIRLSDTRIELTLNGTRLTSKLIDGRFADYERVIPRASDMQSATFRRDDLEHAVAVAHTVFSNKRYQVAVRFDNHHGNLTVTGQEDEANASHTIAALSGGAFTLSTGFQPKYITSILKHIKGDARIFFNDKNGPVRIEDTARPGDCFVLMPCRV